MPVIFSQCSLLQITFPSNAVSLLNEKGETDAAGGWIFEPNHAVINSHGCSEALWRMLGYGRMIATLICVVKDLQLLPSLYLSSSVRVKSWFLLFFFFLEKIQIHVQFLGREERGAFFLCACLPQKQIMFPLPLGLTWFIVVNKIRVSASLKFKCMGRVVPRCWCRSSPSVMGTVTHLQAEGICPVGASRLSVSSETRRAWQPLPRLKARTYSL